MAKWATYFYSSSRCTCVLVFLHQLLISHEGLVSLWGRTKNKPCRCTWKHTHTNTVRKLYVFQSLLLWCSNLNTFYIVIWREDHFKKYMVMVLLPWRMISKQVLYLNSVLGWHWVSSNCSEWWGWRRLGMNASKGQLRFSPLERKFEGQSRGGLDTWRGKEQEEKRRTTVMENMEIICFGSQKKKTE